MEIGETTEEAAAQETKEEALAEVTILLLQQNAEKVLQRHSRITQRLDVPKRTPRPFARCGLAGRPF